MNIILSLLIVVSLIIIVTFIVTFFILQEIKLKKRFISFKSNFLEVDSADKWKLRYEELICFKNGLTLIHHKRYYNDLYNILIEKRKEIYKLKPSYDFEKELAQELADSLNEIKKYKNSNTDDYLENIEKFKDIIKRVKYNYFKN